MSKSFSAVSTQNVGRADAAAVDVTGEEYEVVEDETLQQQPEARLQSQPASLPTRATRVKAASVWQLPPAHFAKQARQDMGVLKNEFVTLEKGAPYTTYLGTMRFASLEQRFEAARPLFERPETEPYTVDEENTLRQLFGDLSRSLATLDRISQRYNGYLAHPGNDGASVGNALYRGAEALGAKHALKFYRATGENLRLSRLLDEAAPQQGLGPGEFTKLEKRVAALHDVLQLRVSKSFARRADVDAATEKNPGLAFVASEYRTWMRAQTEKDHDQVQTLAKGLGVAIAARARVRSSKRGAIAWLTKTFVKPIATWFGDTRMGTGVVNAALDKTHRPGNVAKEKWDGERMVKPAHVKQLISMMQPGDIGVVRQDWFLSNLKLPGHWPHAILHIGAPNELAAFFDGDKDVQAMVAKKSGGKYAKFSEYLQATYPDKWKDYTGLDEHGEQKRVVEAISEGVLFTGPAHAFHVDYAGIMRPRVSKTDKAIAILRAFDMAGLPYDFNFDFATRDAIVCSELVYRAYQPGDGMQTGVKTPLVKVKDLGGRWTLPANGFVAEFDRGHDSDNKQLDFVAYLQGDTKSFNARFATEAEFQKSYALPQYDWQVPEGIDRLKKQAAEHAKLGEPWEFKG